MDYKWLLLALEGRLNRQPYWMTLLAMIVISVVAAILDAIIGTSGTGGAGAISLIVAVAMIWPGIALAVKRLHDRGRTGWFYLLLLVPILNIWILIEIWFLRGTHGDNAYGPDPLGGA